jgi:hypothetical protein
VDVPSRGHVPVAKIQHDGQSAKDKYVMVEKLGHPEASQTPRGYLRVGALPVLEGPAQPNQRLKLSACGRRLRRNAQWKLFILSAAPVGRSLSAIC